MDEKEFKRAINFYRDIAENEIKKEIIMDGTLIGPRSEVKTGKLTIDEVANPSRPFLADDTCGLDSKYVTTFRMGHFNMPEQLFISGKGTNFVGGMEFGSNLVRQNIINNLDDLVSFLLDYKIGIVDIYNEKEEEGDKIFDIRVYECIECAHLPNRGKPICFFEAGVITGVFKELTKKDVVAEEVRCWTSGYSFCQFDVILKED